MGAKKIDFLAALSPYQTKLYNFIIRSTNDCADADDLYQETLLKAFQYFASYDQNRPIKPWLFTIACNTIRDYFRKQKPVLSLDRMDIPDQVDKKTKENIREIFRTAARLKPRQRQVFFLYYYNNFKISEISDITGLSSYNIKFILSQSRRAVKKRLEELK